MCYSTESIISAPLMSLGRGGAFRFQPSVFTQRWKEGESHAEDVRHEAMVTPVTTGFLRLLTRGTQGLTPPGRGTPPPADRMCPSNIAILALMEATPGLSSPVGVMSGLRRVRAVSGVVQVSEDAPSTVPRSTILRGGSALPLPGLGSVGGVGLAAGFASTAVALPGLLEAGGGTGFAGWAGVGVSLAWGGGLGFGGAGAVRAG